MTEETACPSVGESGIHRLGSGVGCGSRSAIYRQHGADRHTAHRCHDAGYDRGRTSAKTPRTCTHTAGYPHLRLLSRQALTNIQHPRRSFLAGETLHIRGIGQRGPRCSGYIVPTIQHWHLTSPPRRVHLPTLYPEHRPDRTPPIGTSLFFVSSYARAASVPPSLPHPWCT